MAFGVLALAVAGVAAGLLLTRGGQNTADTAPAAWSAAAYQGGPRLAVDRELVDAGSVPYGTKVQATFRLKNVGDQPIQLQPPDVQTLEGC